VGEFITKRRRGGKNSPRTTRPRRGKTPPAMRKIGEKGNPAGHRVFCTVVEENKESLRDGESLSNEERQRLQRFWNSAV